MELKSLTVNGIRHDMPDPAEYNPNRHAEYFTITDDGIVALKPEYRGACPSNRSDFTYAISDNGIGYVGSKNTELPKCLIVPEVVEEIAVVSLAPGMFLQNRNVETLTLPYFITAIPDRFCDNAQKLKNLYNTENVETIGMTGFQNTRLEKAIFPSLTSMGLAAFNLCPCMVYADVGNITSVPQNCFSTCDMLSSIKGGANITTIAKSGFLKTYRLKNVEFLPKLTSIGDTAFLCSRIDYDWSSLSGCTFGTNATSKQINPTDIWSACTITAAENPLPTMFNQNDPRWANRQIGASGLTYSKGCMLMSAIHVYCGINNLAMESVEEFEEIANEASSGILDGFTGSMSNLKALLEAVGLTVEYYSGYTKTNLQALYNAFANGKYAILVVPGSATSAKGHAVTAYGVKSNGEIMMIDSDPACSEIGITDKALTYCQPYQTGIFPSNPFIIVSH